MNGKVQPYFAELDEFVGKRFGKEGQVEVLGWFGEKRAWAKVYTIICHTCKNDSELFGDGKFLAEKSSLMKGKLPCGCTKMGKWSKEQKIVLCHRKAAKMNVEITRIDDDKIFLRCRRDNHEWTSTIKTFMDKRGGCQMCSLQVVPRKKDNDEFVANKLMATGLFHEDTLFWKCEKEVKGKDSWRYICPRCSTSNPQEIFEGCRQNMLQGYLPCSCRKTKTIPKDANFIIYVLEVTSDTGSFTGYGITRDLTTRLKHHKMNLKKRQFVIQNYKTFNDISPWLASKIERKIKANFIVTPQEVKGFITEATLIENYPSVVSFVENIIQEASVQD